MLLVYGNTWEVEVSREIQTVVNSRVKPLDSRIGTLSSRQSQVDLWTNCRNTQFVAMLDLYRASGGIVRAEDLVMTMRSKGGPDISTLARWIVERKVICFEWEQEMWLPQFQFCTVNPWLREDISSILREIQTDVDPWDLALWFVRFNGWLDGRTPLDSINKDCGSVLNAAKATREPLCE